MREGTLEPSSAGGVAGSAESSASESRKLDHQALEEAVQYVLADCFFAVGQTIGMRMTVDYEAVVWWHDHFRTKFLAALRRHGDRWLQDRESVTAVGWMLAERAVRHAAGKHSIHIQAAREAAADVERYCQIRSARASRRGERNNAPQTRHAGYWCISFPY
ncbi:MAG: hypothetical protein OXH69_13560 [Acidobacteria bacterium]|nr:hypothetical protein [Acidobacteriota bacterium]